MITFRVKMLNGKIMWDAPWGARRGTNRNARRDLRLRKYRRLSWWSQDRWNQRHGINEG